MRRGWHPSMGPHRTVPEKVVTSFLGLTAEAYGYCDQCDARVSRHELHHYSASSLADECDVCSECVAKASY